MVFEKQELERYARHIVLADVGGPGQQKLKQARVLVIGAGGLGTPMIQYLAAAGVGTIAIIDDDLVSLSNLQRQVIHDTDMVGTAKVESAKRAVARINPHVLVEAYAERLTPENALDLIGKYDVIADGSDNFETRYLVSDASYFSKKTLVSGAVGQFDGSVTTFKSHELDSEGQPNPTYRCLFPEKPDDESIPTCATAGILGALTGVVGSMQALEVIKEIIGIGDGLVGRILLYDSRSIRFEMIRYRWNKSNPLNGQSSSTFDELWN